MPPIRLHSLAAPAVLVSMYKQSTWKVDQIHCISSFCKAQSHDTSLQPYFHTLDFNYHILALGAFQICTNGIDAKAQKTEKHVSLNYIKPGEDWIVYSLSRRLP